MNRKTLALATLVGLLALAVFFGQGRRSRDGASPAGSNDDGRANIVLLVIDTLRADLLGCYGFSEDTSPELDQIAAKGVAFDKVIAQCSWTRPSVASLITSRYPRSLGIYKEKFDILADRHQTLAEILRAEGYRTLGITANPNLNKVFNFQQGFDEYAETNVVWWWMTPERGKKKHKKDPSAHLPTSREVFRWVLDRARQSGRPAYVQIDIMEVHSPYLVRKEYVPLFQDYPVRKHAFYSEREVKAAVWGTLAAVRQVSHDTASFMEELTSLPGWKNTLFIITSDHGQGLDDHPSSSQSLLHGNLLYESETMVPLILYNPGDPGGLPAGKRVGRMVRLIDLMPTVLDYLGIEAPGGVVGKSLLPLVRDGQAPALPDVFFTETHWRKVNKIAAYGSAWKYIENRDGWMGANERELQPMGVKENGKLTDAIDVHPEAAERLRAALLSWEKLHPRAASVQPDQGPSEEELKQLKALGYLK